MIYLRILAAVLLFVAIVVTLIAFCDWRDGKAVKTWQVGLAWSLFYLVAVID